MTPSDPNDPGQPSTARPFATPPAATGPATAGTPTSAASPPATPAPDSPQHDATPLADILIRRIRANGPVSIAEYMAECLLHPQHGYYATRDPFGVAGDFTTAPEISQMYGEVLGLALAQSWLDQGAPAPFTLAEPGPGRGTLMADILRATARVPGFHAAARLHLVEASPTLRALQAQTLAPFATTCAAPVWHDTIDTLPDAPLFLIANEFFDALPIRQFIRAAQNGPAGGGSGTDAAPTPAAPRDTTASDRRAPSGAAAAPGIDAPGDALWHERVIGLPAGPAATRPHTAEPEMAMPRTTAAGRRTAGPAMPQTTPSGLTLPGPGTTDTPAPDSAIPPVPPLSAQRPSAMPRQRPKAASAAKGPGASPPPDPAPHASAPALCFGLTPAAPRAGLAHRAQDTRPGDLVEICPALPGIVAAIAERIARHGGVALIVDYGAEVSLGDTLQALRHHATDDPLAHPGEADLTAHVDFDAIRRAATAPIPAPTASPGTTSPTTAPSTTERPEQSDPLEGAPLEGARLQDIPSDTAAGGPPPAAGAMPRGGAHPGDRPTASASQPATSGTGGSRRAGAPPPSDTDPQTAPPRRAISVSPVIAQGILLERLGITARARALAAPLTGAALDSHIRAHRRLTHPAEMGNLFKAIALYPRSAPQPPGFAP